MEIKLSRGFSAIVDDEDYEKVSKYKWYASVRKNYPYLNYAKRNQRLESGRRTQVMHELILEVPKGMVVDHKNGNTLDNRKLNLRICLNKQNSLNTGLRRDNPTGYKGVTYDKPSKKYRSKIRVNKKLIYLGLFKSAKRASVAYIKAAKKYHGEFCNV